MSAPDTAEGAEARQFLEDVQLGLRAAPPRIPAKYLYDELGSRLFDEICEQDDYYPTRTELSILRASAREIAERAGEGCLLLELGSGSSVKTRVLLDRLKDPAAYVPIDISREHLLRSAEALSESYPALPVMPVCADFTQLGELPEPRDFRGRRVLFFPGSTVGNLEPEEANELLASLASWVGPGAGLVIGVDLEKDAATLERAYDDSEGATARFELNLLDRMNRELDADFEAAAWEYRARYDAQARCIEMAVVSRRPQRVRIADAQFDFDAGEKIVTERAYKYSVERFRELAASAGWQPEALWTDPGALFSVQFFAAV